MFFIIVIFLETSHSLDTVEKKEIIDFYYLLCDEDKSQEKIKKIQQLVRKNPKHYYFYNGAILLDLSYIDLLEQNEMLSSEIKYEIKNFYLANGYFVRQEKTLKEIEAMLDFKTEVRSLEEIRILTLSYVYQLQGKKAMFEKTLKSILDENPDYPPDIIHELMLISLLLGKNHFISRYIDRYIKSNKENKISKEFYQELFMMNKKREKTDFSKVYEACPFDLTFTLLYSSQLFFLSNKYEDHKKSLQIFDRYIKSNGVSPLIFNFLYGEVLLYFNRLDEARYNFQKILAAESYHYEMERESSRYLNIINQLKRRKNPCCGKRFVKRSKDRFFQMYSLREKVELNLYYMILSYPVIFIFVVLFFEKKRKEKELKND